MIRFTFYKPGKATAAATTRPNRVRQQLARGYMFVQWRWSQWMKRRMEKLSRKAQLLLWALFFLIAFGYCSTLICKSLYSESAPIGSGVKTIPKLQRKRGNLYPGSNSATPPKKLLQYRQLLDSLASSPFGRRDYEALIRRHPGLLDSLRAIESYYKYKS